MAVEGRAAFTGCPGSPSTVSREPRPLTDGLRGFRGRPGDFRGMAVSLAAPTRPEAVRISGAGQGDRGIILDDFSLRFNNFDKYALTKR